MTTTKGSSTRKHGKALVIPRVASCLDELDCLSVPRSAAFVWLIASRSSTAHSRPVMASSRHPGACVRCCVFRSVIRTSSSRAPPPFTSASAYSKIFSSTPDLPDDFFLLLLDFRCILDCFSRLLLIRLMPALVTFPANIPRDLPAIDSGIARFHVDPRRFKHHCPSTTPCQRSH